MSNKKKTSILTGLIVGGAVVSVAAMMVSKQKRHQLPDALQQDEKPEPISLIRRLMQWIFKRKK